MSDSSGRKSNSTTWLGLGALAVALVIAVVLGTQTGQSISPDLSDGTASATTVIPASTSASPSSAASSSSPSSSSSAAESTEPTVAPTTAPPTTAPTTSTPPPAAANTIDATGLTYCGWKRLDDQTTLIATGDDTTPVWLPSGDPGLQIGQTYRFVRSGTDPGVIVGDAGVDPYGPGLACPARFATDEWHNG